MGIGCDIRHRLNIKNPCNRQAPLSKNLVLSNPFLLVLCLSFQNLQEYILFYMVYHLLKFNIRFPFLIHYSFLEFEENKFYKWQAVLQQKNLLIG